MIDLETALKILRTLPRTARERLGVADLPTELARRIRESGAAAIGQMKVLTTESGDIGDHVTELLAAIRSDDPVESVQRFAGVQPFASLSAARTEAEQRERHFPLHPWQGRRTLTSDGRTVYRSPASDDATIYGEKAATWEGMIEHYQLRVNLLGGVVLPRAWRQLSTDHRLHIGDFQALAAGSAIVPSTHEGVFARGLHYGYSGDFGAAVHLLVPAIEALVRLHLANAGERTERDQRRWQRERDRPLRAHGERAGHRHLWRGRCVRTSRTAVRPHRPEPSQRSRTRTDRRRGVSQVPASTSGGSRSSSSSCPTGTRCTIQRRLKRASRPFQNGNRIRPAARACRSIPLAMGGAADLRTVFAHSSRPERSGDSPN